MVFALRPALERLPDLPIEVGTMSRRPRWIAALAALLVVVAGCDYPRDAQGTLDRVRGGVIRVGYAGRPPFVLAESGRREGIEPRLVRAFADELGASIEWVPGSQLDLLHALEKRRLDLVICGLTRDAPSGKRGARSLPYLKARLVIARQPGISLALEGSAVAVREGRPDIAAALGEKEATHARVPAPRAPLAAVYDFEAKRLGLEPSDAVLATEELVILAAPGENRFLLELDRFIARSGRRLALEP
jgi:polar amino acid transport system substrate-binding protein